MSNKERAKFKLVGEWKGLIEGHYYDVPALCHASNLKVVTLRERLSRKNARDVVLSSDLQPVGLYRQVAERCETSAEKLSQDWLCKSIVEPLNWA